ncbi:MAG: NAD(P)/FAD-dependent oxidoreductase [Hyphomicrobiaceae bacterium]
MPRSFDVCVVGGGIIGLWVARRLVDAGIDTVVVERGVCGSGASGGVLGALTAHAPDNWNDKKQFQFEALSELPGLIAALENETGVAAGYARCGRLMPIRTEKFRAQALRRSAASRQTWLHGGRPFGYDVVELDDCDRWLSPSVAPLGAIRDDLAARVDPARYVQAVKASLQDRATILENWSVAEVDSRRRRVVPSDGGPAIAVDKIVVAAGYTSFELLQPIVGQLIGGGVKGQAAVFHCPEAAGRPLLYDDGIYVVPHEGDFCAVGSTSEKRWHDEATPDVGRTDFIDKARSLCPALRDASLIRHWAGVRPRCHRTDPIVGPVTSDRSVWVATGGYKITFGIAHRLAAALADEILTGHGGVALPSSFRPPYHLTTVDASLGEHQAPGRS